MNETYWFVHENEIEAVITEIVISVIEDDGFYVDMWLIDHGIAECFDSDYATIPYIRDVIIQDMFNMARRGGYVYVGRESDD